MRRTAAIVALTVGLAGCNRMLPTRAYGENGLIEYKIRATHGPWQQGQPLWMEVAGIDTATGDRLGMPDSVVHEVFIQSKEERRADPILEWTWVDDHVRRAEWAMEASGMHKVTVLSYEVVETGRSGPEGQPIHEREDLDQVEFRVDVQ